MINLLIFSRSTEAVVESAEIHVHLPLDTLTEIVGRKPDFEGNGLISWGITNTDLVLRLALYGPKPDPNAIEWPINSEQPDTDGINWLTELRSQFSGPEYLWALYAKTESPST